MSHLHNSSETGYSRSEPVFTRIIALAGNPNVGKSTLFNQLTGLKQHTGNWPGKTVTLAHGNKFYENTPYTFVDLPGTYSLLSHSTEEETARDFICFGNADAVVVVCDATCLERNLNLVFQTIEITNRVVVCINLIDEAEKHGIHVNLEKLQDCLGVPVVGTNARSKKGLRELMEKIHSISSNSSFHPILPRYNKPIEDAISIIENALNSFIENLNHSTSECNLFSVYRLPVRWLALKLLDYNQTFYESLKMYCNCSFLRDESIQSAILNSYCVLINNGISREHLQEDIVASLICASENICENVISIEENSSAMRNQKLDKILTNRVTGIPIMLLLLCGIFWLTITGANYPSTLLSHGLFWIQDRLSDLCYFLGVPEFIHGALVLGVYRSLAWVISVMLPPMAIFFPLFTLLEDLGYLPRIAFNLDHHFKKAHACGKQALTICMGFGCNAVGVTGCRIIDSKREQLIAILTNNFVPCNGRFPQPYKRKQNCSSPLIMKKQVN